MTKPAKGVSVPESTTVGGVAVAPARPRGRPPRPAVASPPVPGGWQGWREEDEVQLEQRGPQKPADDEDAIEVRVVYLGNDPNHSVPLRGGLIWHTRDDGSTFATPAPAQHEGTLSYNFASQDSRGRTKGTLKRTRTDDEGNQTVVELPVVRRTKDGRPWAICRHIGHAAIFLNLRNRDKQPQYWLRAPDETIQKINAYDERRRQARQQHPDSNVNVLRQIQPTSWRDLGGPVGEQLA